MGRFEMSDKYQNEVQALRDKINSVKEELEDLDSGPVPRDVAISRIDEWIAFRIDQSNDAAKHFLAQEYTRQPALAASRTNVDHSEIIFARYATDLIRASLIAEIDKIYADAGPGLSSADLAKKRREIEARLFKLEVAEERAIVAAAANGVPIPRRRDADPRAILEA